MNKKVYLFAAIAAMFAACSSNDGAESLEKTQAQAQAQQIPVGFDSYVGRSTTRAGQSGIQNIGQLKQDKVGFGVFAYYTNANSYDQTFTPNFMYNQQVKWDGTENLWSYEPVKYWPNEFGADALSDDVDKLSFFAYAPFVSVAPGSGKVVDESTTTYAEDNGDVTWGIVGMKNNTATGDPMVKYITAFYTDKQVDLTWGTVADPAPTWANKGTGNTTLTVGKPWTDIEHPTVTSSTWLAAQKVTFDFKHSLAALNVTVDTKTNATTPAAPNTETKVFIRSVTFEGFDTKGALNLNNTDANKALWFNFDGQSELNNGSSFTIQDGRKDGKEGITEATKENRGINPNFIQNAVWGALAVPGVNGTPANLFCKSDYSAPDAAGDPIFVIPNNDKLKVTIEYDVLTKDKNLAGKLNDGATSGSVVKNVISRYITASGAGDPTTGNVTLENGKKYTISLHLGLNSVEFDATVANWDGTPVTGGADLPHNN